MNFFEQQNKTRRKTALLVLYFALAVTLIVVGINLVVFYASQMSGGFAGTPEQWLDKPFWLWITLGTCTVIGLGTLFTFIQLRGGGHSVAEMVGARLVEMTSTDPGERRLINVVEEMSIAAGTPVPTLYVMDAEPGINAFVAGYQVKEAVLVVTSGTLAELSRDELQGVIGHEFSHILNGDMRMNVRLIAILAGILLLGQMGYFLLRSMRYSGRSSSSRESGGAALALLGLGAALFVLGYIGLFFGRLIKAAISRQREFLADASAVQFTRNPDGIAGALWKIKGHSTTSHLSSSHAEDMSHMCFGESLHLRFSSVFATHPPLEERIRVIAPGFDFKQTSSAPSAAKSGPTPAGAMGFAAGSENPQQISSAALVDSVGNPTPAHMAYAVELCAALPLALREAARDPSGARNLNCALILADADPSTFERGIAYMIEAYGEEAGAQTKELVGLMQGLSKSTRLPIIELTFPALARLDLDQRGALITDLKRLINADKRFSLFEFVLLTLLQDHLEPSAARDEPSKYFRFDDVLEEVRALISLFARIGAKNDDGRQDIFEQVMRSFTAEQLSAVPGKEMTAARLVLCLRELSRLSPLLKRSLLNACADCVLHDQQVMPAELELLRATSTALDCPMPPVLGNGQP